MISSDKSRIHLRKRKITLRISTPPTTIRTEKTVNIILSLKLRKKLVGIFVTSMFFAKLIDTRRKCLSTTLDFSNKNSFYHFYVIMG